MKNKNNYLRTNAKKQAYKNKGITLIALIITIVLLIILLGVSIDLIIDGKIFNSAEKAVNGTNAKVAQEQSRVDELMGKLNQIEGKVDKDNNTIMITKINDGISYISTAEGGMSEMHSVLQRYRVVVESFCNNYSEADKAQVQLELQQLLQYFDSISNETVFNNEKLLDGSFNKSIGINELILQIDNLSSSSLGLDITAIDTNLASTEAALQYLEIINEALNKVSKNRMKCATIQDALYILSDYYTEENNIINSSTINMDKKIAKAGLNSIKGMLKRNKTYCEQSILETFSTDDKQSFMAQMDALLIAIDHIANNADYNGQKLLDGTFSNISRINTTTLGGGTKLSTDVLTTEAAESAKTQYQNAIDMVEREIAKLGV